MEFRLCVETRLDGRILERELVSSVERPARTKGVAIAPMLSRFWSVRYFLLPLAAIQLAYWGIQVWCWQTLHH
jgi:hypothetical protein